MRIILFSAIAAFQISCGTYENRYSIDESSVSSGSNQETGVAFHSSVGWADSVVFYTESNVPDQMVEAAEDSAQTWNDAAGKEILTFAGIIESERGTTLYQSLDDAVTVVYFEEDWGNTTGKSTTTLATTIWENSGSSDEIVKGDIIMNAEIYNFQDAAEASYASDDAYSIVDSETVLLHEFGHLLGLDHVSADDDDESVMNPKTFIGPQMHVRELSAEDEVNIQDLYQ